MKRQGLALFSEGLDLVLPSSKERKGYYKQVDIQILISIYTYYGARVFSSLEIHERLKQDGWFEVAQKGSHKQFKHPDKTGKVTLPHPKRDLPLGTVRSIWRQAGWPWPPQ